MNVRRRVNPNPMWLFKIDVERTLDNNVLTVIRLARFGFFENTLLLGSFIVAS